MTLEIANMMPFRGFPGLLPQVVVSTGFGEIGRKALEDLYLQNIGFLSIFSDLRVFCTLSMPNLSI
jgi:hypothetical protein